jgi:hypothetical protein
MATFDGVGKSGLAHNADVDYDFKHRFAEHQSRHEHRCYEGVPVAAVTLLLPGQSNWFIIQPLNWGWSTAFRMPIASTSVYSDRTNDTSGC